MVYREVRSRPLIQEQTWEKHIIRNMQAPRNLICGEIEIIQEY